MSAITIVQGAMWGSEAKGAVTGALAIDPAREYRYAVRTGAINAGHTVYYKGKPYAMQQLPVAWVHPEIKLVIGPGAYVHAPTLLREIAMIHEATGVNPIDRIFIDHRAGVHLDAYTEEATEAGRHALIGATGKGCAEAIVHKIRDRGRNSDLIFSESNHGEYKKQFLFVDVPEMLTDAYERGEKILIEGCQGELLDFHLGPWPYVTSRQTTSAAWIAEAGLSPNLRYEVIAVARTFPIRVAGNSGPLPNEITWPDLAREINGKVAQYQYHPMRVDEGCIRDFEMTADEVGEAHAFSELAASTVAELRKLFEFTTVTKKLRRVARYDKPTVDRTFKLMRPEWAVLTFLNYVFPELYGATTIPDYARRWVEALHPAYRAVTTGPLPGHLVYL